ncbi:alpha/beta fold hydrolase [Corynebacterium sp. TA-R-1]|uniref:Alpha/beta fold hydrolase n=1 Tax=Corynebacterium stercoris TaxID=2943490 RepID=A0ABT1G3A5_9CORY|nr:alpha/beta fold hydrolase [Corynebacterium stercoris]MCP1388479.1 alpha/beta fold hydrolase [Corynebacterium stercoris]
MSKSPLVIAPPETFPAADASAPRQLVVVMPGMGMEGRYYRPIAQALADAGFPTAIGELRGQGRSPQKATRANQWGYHHVASEDFPQTIIEAKRALALADDHSVILLTHSMGGQVGVLFMARPEARELNVVGLLGVGAGSPWYRAFPWRDRLKYGLGIQTIWAFTQLIGFWPGDKVKIGGTWGRHPRTYINEWARMNRAGKRGELAGADIDYVAAMGEIEAPVVLTRFTNDRDCTVASAEKLAEPVASARVEELDGGLGHNKWAREPEIVVKRMLEFAESL